jgi:hypothetical protein
LSGSRRQQLPSIDFHQVVTFVMFCQSSFFAARRDCAGSAGDMPPWALRAGPLLFVFRLKRTPLAFGVGGSIKRKSRNTRRVLETLSNAFDGVS